MKIALYFTSGLVFGCVLCYQLVYMVEAVHVSRVQGQLDVLSNLCRPEIDKAGIVKKGSK